MHQSRVEAAKPSRGQPHGANFLRRGQLSKLAPFLISWPLRNFYLLQIHSLVWFTWCTGFSRWTKSMSLACYDVQHLLCLFVCFVFCFVLFLEFGSCRVSFFCCELWVCMFIVNFNCWYVFCCVLILLFLLCFCVGLLCVVFVFHCLLVWKFNPKTSGKFSRGLSSQKPWGMAACGGAQPRGVKLPCGIKAASLTKGSLLE